MKNTARLTLKKTLQILQKDKIINKKNKENSKLREKVQKLQEQLNIKYEKKTKKVPNTVTNLCDDSDPFWR